MQATITQNFAKTLDWFLKGKIISYPTEAVFGLGCDPENIQAVLNLINLKKRSKNKGLILIAPCFELLQSYVDLSKIPDSKLKILKNKCQTPTTWLVPKSTKPHELLSGQFDSIAVRICTTPFVAQFCTLANKPLVSTSANFSNQNACTTTVQVLQNFYNQEILIFDDKTEGLKSPSKIVDLISGEVIRS